MILALSGGAIYDVFVKIFMEKGNIQQVVVEFLKNNATAVVSTCVKNQPEAATVFYVIDDELNLYFVTRRSSRKFKNLSSNNKVAVVVGTDAQNPTTVQMEGEASYSVNLPAIAKLFKVVWKEKKLNNPLLYLKGLDFSIFKVKPKWMRFMHLEEDCEQYHEIALKA